MEKQEGNHKKTDERIGIDLKEKDHSTKGAWPALDW